MSVKTFNSAHDFVGHDEKSGFFKAISSFFASISNGVRLAHDYKELTSRGVRPEVASRRVFETIDQR